MKPIKSLSNFARYVWLVLAYNILVILWGAYVRATGSGAGCGSHWPACTGEIIPRSPSIETLIEFSHRLSSGLALLLVLGLVIWTWRSYPKGHPVRLGAGLSGFFIITEALLGAGLVLFGLVAEDTSLQRAVSVSLHLANTFLLLASLSLTAWWASGGSPLRWQGRGVLLTLLIPAALGLLFIGMSGALTALGDTLFPVDTLQEGLSQDFAADVHFLIRLRLLHPLIAVVVSLYLIVFVGILSGRIDDPRLRSTGRLLSALVTIQIGAGFLNVYLLAPIWLQIVHLLLADLMWVTFIFLTAFALRPEMQARLHPRPVLSP